MYIFITSLAHTPESVRQNTHYKCIIKNVNCVGVNATDIRNRVILLQYPLEPGLQHVINVSYDFECDLMIRSDQTNCIYIQNLQRKPMGK